MRWKRYVLLLTLTELALQWWNCWDKWLVGQWANPWNKRRNYSVIRLPFTTNGCADFEENVGIVTDDPHRSFLESWLAYTMPKGNYINRTTICLGFLLPLPSLRGAQKWIPPKETLGAQFWFSDPFSLFFLGAFSFSKRRFPPFEIRLFPYSPFSRVTPKSP